MGRQQAEVRPLALTLLLDVGCGTWEVQSAMLAANQWLSGWLGGSLSTSFIFLVCVGAVWSPSSTASYTDWHQQG